MLGLSIISLSKEETHYSDYNSFGLPILLLALLTCGNLNSQVTSFGVIEYDLSIDRITANNPATSDNEDEIYFNVYVFDGSQDLSLIQNQWSAHSSLITLPGFLRCDDGSINCAFTTRKRQGKPDVWKFKKNNFHSDINLWGTIRLGEGLKRIFLVIIRDQEYGTDRILGGLIMSIENIYGYLLTDWIFADGYYSGIESVPNPLGTFGDKGRFIVEGELDNSPYKYTIDLQVAGRRGN